MAVRITYLGIAPRATSLECQDNECDTCPGWWQGILVPSKIYQCDCSCHD